MSTTNTPGVPRAAQLSTNPATITWQSTSIGFNGYVWIGLNLPDGYSQPSLFNSYITQQLPRFIKVPIVNGTIDTTTGVPYTSDIDPPGTNYVAYYMDNNNAIIAPTSGSASPFSIGNSIQVLTVPPLPLPSYASATEPIPQTSTYP